MNLKGKIRQKGNELKETTSLALTELAQNIVDQGSHRHLVVSYPVNKTQWLMKPSLTLTVGCPFLMFIQIHLPNYFKYFSLLFIAAQELFLIRTL